MSIPISQFIPPPFRTQVFFFFFFFLFFWLHHAAYGILVPHPGIEPVPPAVEARSPNHWASREFPGLKSLMWTGQIHTEKKKKR